MKAIFNSFPNNSLFSLKHFRISYTLLSPIRNLIANFNQDEINVVSIACGAALELSTLELLARSRGVKINYVGCDIDSRDLKFNIRVLQKKAPSVNQIYIHSDIASAPPVFAISHAHCIIWRHPEFLSDHDETPKRLILDMCHILWNILENKSEEAPILITCYDPHEMMVILELLQQFCEEDLKYNLNIDMHDGRASWQNPIIEPDDRDPLFNLNHQDQCQLIITQCHLKKMIANSEVFLSALSKAFQNIVPRIQTNEQITPTVLLEHLDEPTLDVLREATSYLNNQIREDDNPFAKRDQLLAVLKQSYSQPEMSHPLTY
ncbi:hypothetical protein [Legionella bononiensis]|nr:hypothetical protein [Legionella bononiensis]